MQLLCSLPGSSSVGEEGVMRGQLAEQAREILGQSDLVMITERVDDVALLIGQMVKMGLPEVLDRHIPRHWRQRRISWGWTAVIWLAYILTEGDHRKVSVETYLKGMYHTLSRLTAQVIEPLDLSDDRLSRCSSANTLRIQRLKFGREKLTKGPDVIRHACRQRWCALQPARTNRTMVCALMQWQRLSQAHVRSGHVVKGLEEDHSLPQALAVFTEAGCLTGQRCQGLTQRQVHPFDQGCADRMAQGRQAFGSKHDAGAERPQFALLLLFDQRPVDQIRMGLTAGLAWASPLAGACTRGHDVESSDQGRQRAREAVAEARRNARDTRLRDGHDFLGSVERTRSHHGCDPQPKLGGKADPDPLPPLLAVWQAFPSCVCLTRVLARDEVPHLVELSLGHRQRPQQGLVDRFGLVRRASQPRQHGLFGDPEPKADPRQINPDQEHLEGHHDFFFRGTEVEKDGLACLRKGRRACVATKEASLAALGEVRCDSTDVAKLHTSRMNARGIGARLAPIFGFPPRAILRGV